MNAQGPSVLRWTTKCEQQLQEYECRSPSPRLTFVSCVTVGKSLNLSEFGSHLSTPVGC